jgi:hypothetical protein
MAPLLPRTPLRTVTRAVPTVAALCARSGYVLAGLAHVAAQNLRTLGDGERPLADRARAVGRDSLGAALAGPSGLSDRGRSLLGRDGRVPRDGTAEQPSGQAAEIATSPSAAPEAAPGGPHDRHTGASQ